MGELEVLIKNYCKERQAEAYSLETVYISTDTKIEENEVIFITSTQSTLFAYYSADDYADDTQGKKITQNVGSIKILYGMPQLIGLKLTITKYKQTEKETWQHQKKSQLEIQVMR